MTGSYLAWILSYVAAWGLCVAQLSAAFGMFWAVGRINNKKDPATKVLMTDEGPPIYGSFPWFEAYAGEQLIFRTDDYKGKEWVLLMLSPQCEPCYQLLKTGIGSALRDWDTSIKLVVVLEGEGAEQGVPMPPYPAVDYITDKQTLVRHKLGVDNTPYGFLMDAAGTVRMKGVVNGSGQLLGLSQANGQRLGGSLWQDDEFTS